VLDIDVQGARSVRKAGARAIFVFVAPPSLEELERRLVGGVRRCCSTPLHPRQLQQLVLGSAADRLRATPRMRPHPPRSPLPAPCPAAAGQPRHGDAGAGGAPPGRSARRDRGTQREGPV
jgi:hypothetical protein